MGCPKNKVDSDGIEMLLQDGDYFRVTVAAACASNSLIGVWFYLDKTFSESVAFAFH